MLGPEVAQSIATGCRVWEVCSWLYFWHTSDLINNSCNLVLGPTKGTLVRRSLDPPWLPVRV